MYGDALGVNGQAGMDRARSAFTASPGYQFSLNQGLQAIDRGAAARGMLSSGNTLAAEQNYGTGLANQEYGNWLSGLGSYNSVAPSLAGAQAGLYGNLGNLNYGYGTNLAQLGWNRDTGIGQANAAAAMAPYNASGNFWNLFGNLAGDATKALGYGLPGGGTIGGAMYAASDRRVKDDVEHVGETNDGQPIYRFRYRGEPVGTARLGLIAQNVEKRDPGAVREFGGVKAVDMKRATEGAAKRSTFGVFSRAA